jgi:hypothetical protein
MQEEMYNLDVEIASDYQEWEYIFYPVFADKWHQFVDET